ncbi:hypothetical protein EYF80_061698 [Liparis tanakae]|uniref:Uncharacterized protein n=1 Tax=Liparis tanakae TaxID=230148 RepID=A0A4Z2EH85_9TELE|nr:hypothetical protein EYF80_061698 [Liparis tanakae]
MAAGWPEAALSEVFHTSGAKVLSVKRLKLGPDLVPSPARAAAWLQDGREQQASLNSLTSGLRSVGRP